MPSGNVSRGTETSEYLALTLALDEVDNLDGGLRDVGHILAMRELTEERRGTDDDIDTVNTWTNSSISRSRPRLYDSTHQFRQLSGHRPYDTGCE